MLRPESAWSVRSQHERRPTLIRCQAEPAEASKHPFPEEEDFDLLSTKIADLVKELNEELRGCSIYLVGMMGSGKSTVGGARAPGTPAAAAGR